jgi:hypothetical protein
MLVPFGNLVRRSLEALAKVRGDHKAIEDLKWKNTEQQKTFLFVCLVLDLYRHKNLIILSISCKFS